MTWYLAGALVHLIAVTAWLGSALVLVAVGHVARLTRAGDMLDHVVHVMAFVVTRVFVPMAVLVLLSGLFMVWIRDLAFQAWEVWGLAGIVISGIIGTSQLGPLSETSAALLENDLTRAAGVAEAQKMLRFATADEGVLVSILFAMVFRPTWGDVPMLAGMAIFVALVAFWGLTRKPVAGLI